jgi:hypothetical protein
MDQQALVEHLPRNFFAHGLRDERLNTLEAEAREEEEGEAGDTRTKKGRQGEAKEQGYMWKKCSVYVV